MAQFFKPCVIDSASGALLRTIDSRTLETAQSFPAWMRRLHGASGAEAPLWLKLIFTVTGAALALLPVSGVWLWRKRAKS